MTVRPIWITGHTVLHRPAKPVVDFDSDLLALITDMQDTMRSAPGVGLAAPQIGVGLRVFVWEWEDDTGFTHEGVVVNPQLVPGQVPRGAPDPDDDIEGCLSVPGLRFPLRRAQTALLTGLTHTGEPLTIAAEGWLARIFQHEMDHLNGTLYIDRLRWRDKRAARKGIRAEEWGASWLPGVDDLEGSGEDAEEAETSGNKTGGNQDD